MRPALVVLCAVSLAACGGGAASPANPSGSGDDAGSDAPLTGDDAADGAAVSEGGADAGGDGTTGDAGGDAGNPNLHVEGNHLVYQGKTTRLLGVDHSGTEYVCEQGNGIFEGPDPDTLATAMLTWGHVNAVRIPLNEDCWLGINGIAAQDSGQAYQTAIVGYLAKLHAHGLFTIVDLHWNAPGTFKSSGQQPMADADHAVDFWTSVATALKGDPMSVFDLYNEPYLSTSNAQTADPWACWLDGCTITQSNTGVTGNWKSAGMQQLVDAVRKTGATNVLMLGGLAYSNDLSGWLAHVPVDPLAQITASFHDYNFNTCVDATCWDGVIAPVAQKHPVITGELGENDCAHGFVDTYMPWADKNGVSYLAWTWNGGWDCKNGPTVIVDYTGAPTGFGQGVKAHLLVTSP